MNRPDYDAATAELTDENIEALMQEASSAGDHEMVNVCRAVRNPNRSPSDRTYYRRLCARAIVDGNADVKLDDVLDLARPVVAAARGYR